MNRMHRPDPPRYTWYEWLLDRIVPGLGALYALTKGKSP